MGGVQQYLNDFVGLFFPHLCVACLQNQNAKNNIFCLQCIYEIPESDTYCYMENQMTQKLFGRFRFEEAFCLYLFHSMSPLRNVMHTIKYRKRLDIAMEIGKYFGTKIIGQSHLGEFDCLVPVPLHPAKHIQRGFNQSEAFARGVSESTGIPVNRYLLRRIRNTDTQTRKTREERIQNVKGAFRLVNPKSAEGQHVLILDDVFTTGATIEACAEEFLKAKDCKVSVCTIAMAES